MMTNQTWRSDLFNHFLFSYKIQYCNYIDPLVPIHLVICIQWFKELSWAKPRVCTLYTENNVAFRLCLQGSNAPAPLGNLVAVCRSCTLRNQNSWVTSVCKLLHSNTSGPVFPSLQICGNTTSPREFTQWDFEGEAFLNWNFKGFGFQLTQLSLWVLSHLSSV